MHRNVLTIDRVSSDTVASTILSIQIVDTTSAELTH